MRPTITPGPEEAALPWSTRVPPARGGRYRAAERVRPTRAARKRREPSELDRVPEQLPREHYLAAAARGRILAAEATTPRVKEYLQSRALECEQLADALGRGVNIPRHDDLDLLA